MGVVYYGHYAQYLEVGRAEAMRAIGFTYRKMEEMGILMPVVELRLQYHRPAKYDDLLTIRTCIMEMPGKTLTFSGEIFNENDRLLTTGSVVLAFLYKETGKTGFAPSALLDILQSRFP